MEQDMSPHINKSWRRDESLRKRDVRISRKKKGKKGRKEGRPSIETWGNPAVVLGRKGRTCEGGACVRNVRRREDRRGWEGTERREGGMRRGER